MSVLWLAWNNKYYNEALQRLEAMQFSLEQVQSCIARAERSLLETQDRIQMISQNIATLRLAGIVVLLSEYQQIKTQMITLIIEEKNLSNYIHGQKKSLKILQRQVDTAAAQLPSLQSRVLPFVPL